MVLSERHVYALRRRLKYIEEERLAKLSPHRPGVRYELGESQALRAALSPYLDEDDQLRDCLRGDSSRMDERHAYNLCRRLRYIEGRLAKLSPNRPGVRYELGESQALRALLTPYLVEDDPVWDRRFEEPPRVDEHIAESWVPGAR